MNILILAKNSEYGGLIMTTRNLAKGIIQSGNKAIIVSSKGEGPTKLLYDLPLLYLDWGAYRITSIIRNYKQLSEIISSNNIDIIHANNRIPALYASVYCFFHRSKKYIWANHLTPLKGGLRNCLLTRYGSYAVAEGIEGAKMLKDTYNIPDNKIKIVNLGVDISNFKKTSSESQALLKKKLGISSEIVILLYGRLCENKGHLFLLDAIACISYRNIKIIFPGQDEDFKKMVIEKANQNGLAENIIFPGFINGIEYLSISDLMVLPSRHEGFPQACIEAYAMGVPVIRTKTGGYEDTKDMCFGVDYGDVEGFASQLNTFFEHNSVFMERASYAMGAVKRLSIESMTRQYLSIYQEVIND